VVDETTQTTVVVLDSSPILADRPLRKRTTKALLDASSRGEIRVVVPQVVIDEVVNAAHGSFRDAGKEISKANDWVSKQLPTPHLWKVPDVDALTDQVRNHLESEFAKHAVEIAKHDSVPNDELVRRDLSRRKPYDESGRGFRDALIWHVLKDLDVENVVFVTRNTNDFADPDDHSRLHEELAEEVEDPHRFTLVPDVSEVIGHLGQQRDGLRGSIEEAIEIDRETIARQALSYVSPALPHRMEGEMVDLTLTSFTVDRVVYWWGVVTASVRASFDYAYSGTLDEWGLEELDSTLNVDVIEWIEDSFTAVVAGDGTLEARLWISYDEADGSVEVVDVEEPDR
jgi:predicted nucleic acid-binding protein